jgi:1-deoxy-D-xylulose-5-phosphate synthase
VDRAWLVGADGATHQGAYDVALLRPIPNIALMVPVAGEDLAPMLSTALERNAPSAIRFPRGTLPVLPPDLAPGKGLIVGARWMKRVDTPQLSIVALGPLALSALSAAEGKRWNVLDARFVAPLDHAALREAAKTGRVLVVEEGTVHGGLGSAVLEFLAEERKAARVRCLGLPDYFVRHGEARAQRAELGLDSDAIRFAAEALL